MLPKLFILLLVKVLILACVMRIFWPKNLLNYLKQTINR